MVLYFFDHLRSDQSVLLYSWCYRAQQYLITPAATYRHTSQHDTSDNPTRQYGGTIETYKTGDPQHIHLPFWSICIEKRCLASCANPIMIRRPTRQFLARTTSDPGVHLITKRIDEATLPPRDCRFSDFVHCHSSESI